MSNSRDHQIPNKPNHQPAVLAPKPESQPSIHIAKDAAPPAKPAVEVMPESDAAKAAAAPVVATPAAATDSAKSAVVEPAKQ